MLLNSWLGSGGIIVQSRRQDHGMEPTVTNAPLGLYPSRTTLLPSPVVTADVPDEAHTMPAKPSGPVSASRFSLDSETNRPERVLDQNQALSPNGGARVEPKTAHTVLVVEDDPDIVMVLQDLLEFEGFYVDCAQSCHQAFSSLGQKAYNAVLLDLELPDGDGCSILAKLQVSHPSLPVIVLTASNRDLGSLRAYARLTKPWKRRELCGILHRAIGSSSRR